MEIGKAEALLNAQIFSKGSEDLSEHFISAAKQILKNIREKNNPVDLKVTDLTDEVIRQLTARMTRQYATSNPLELAERVGLHIVNVDDGRTDWTGRLLTRDGVWLLLINKNLNDNEYRETVASFVIARELLPRLSNWPQGVDQTFIHEVTAAGMVILFSDI
ncbi:MAG TPA: hypothetical protein PKW95_23630 [bacterium]|nr:hypothetical protein [bacterium]